MLQEEDCDAVGFFPGRTTRHPRIDCIRGPFVAEDPGDFSLQSNPRGGLAKKSGNGDEYRPEQCGDLTLMSIKKALVGAHRLDPKPLHPALDTAQNRLRLVGAKVETSAVVEQLKDCRQIRWIEGGRLEAVSLTGRINHQDASDTARVFLGLLGRDG